jgi:hypothetical protein
MEPLISLMNLLFCVLDSAETKEIRTVTFGTFEEVIQQFS